MKVQVYHQRFNRISGKLEGYDLVAEVEADPSNPAAQGGENGALEYAWARTQNIWGSWSKGEFHENGEPNEDYSPNVTVVGPLPEIDGKVYGLRSSMVGDFFSIPVGPWEERTLFECKGCGFERSAKQWLGDVVEA